MAKNKRNFFAVQELIVLFNSIEFAVFLPVVFILYWFVFFRSIRGQNLFLLVASYVFYGWWDWRFLSLIVLSSILDFVVGKKIAEAPDEAIRYRKILLAISVVANLSLLGFFKYFNFFVDGMVDGFKLFGVPFEARRLNIILPVGISFYTFQTLSYTIDVFRRKIEPTHDFVAFSTFVSFFPQLVAGPIERARDLLPQFDTRRSFDYERAVDGMRQMLWGFYKKIVLADQCGIYANEIFSNYNTFNGSTIFVGATFFAFQIYGDFSGYSDIAIGVSRLFGFNLSRNFSYPYFSRDIAEFWRKWHISLTTWFRDYLYIPLGGSRGCRSTAIRNTFVVFIVSGFWHGANWTFIAWGALNALFFVPLMITDKNRKHLDLVASGRLLPTFSELSRMLITFVLVTITWVLFRAENIGQATVCLQKIFSLSFFAPVEVLPLQAVRVICFVMLVEWLQRDKQHALEGLKFNVAGRWLLYLILAVYCASLVNFQSEFVYFQF